MSTSRETVKQSLDIELASEIRYTAIQKIITIPLIINQVQNHTQQILNTDDIFGRKILFLVRSKPNVAKITGNVIDTIEEESGKGVLLLS